MIIFNLSFTSIVSSLSCGSVNEVKLIMETESAM